MKDIVLAADLGGTNLRMAAVSKHGDIYSRVKVKTPRSKSGEDVVALVASAAKEFASELSEPPHTIALAVPGTISSASGIITRAPNIPGLDGFDLVSEIQEAS